jgi:hypothetical protein
LTKLQEHLERVDAELEARTVWALELKAELERLRPQFEERTEWALRLDRELEAQTARTVQLTKDLDQLAWARPLDRIIRRIRNRFKRSSASP